MKAAELVKQVSQDSTSYLRTKITELENLFATSSTVKAEVSENQGENKVKVSVQFDKGSFVATSSDNNNKRAIEVAFDKIRNQFLSWRRGRIEVPFYLDRTDQHDFFVAASLHAPALVDQPMPILIIEDDPIAGEIEKSLLKRLGFEVTVASTAPDAIEALKQKQYTFVILDWMLPFSGGDQILQEVDNYFTETGIEREPTPVITCSSFDKSQIAFPKSQFFHHADHWGKFENLSSLMQRLEIKTKKPLESHAHD